MNLEPIWVPETLLQCRSIDLHLPLNSTNDYEHGKNTTLAPIHILDWQPGPQPIPSAPDTPGPSPGVNLTLVLTRDFPGLRYCGLSARVELMYKPGGGRLGTSGRPAPPSSPHQQNPTTGSPDTESTGGPQASPPASIPVSPAAPVSSPPTATSLPAPLAPPPAQGNPTGPCQWHPYVHDATFAECLKPFTKTATTVSECVALLPAGEVPSSRSGIVRTVVPATVVPIVVVGIACPLLLFLYHRQREQKQHQLDTERPGALWSSSIILRKRKKGRSRPDHGHGPKGAQLPASLKLHHHHLLSHTIHSYQSSNQARGSLPETASGPPTSGDNWCVMFNQLSNGSPMHGTTSTSSSYFMAQQSSAQRTFPMRPYCFSSAQKVPMQEQDTDVTAVTLEMPNWYCTLPDSGTGAGPTCTDSTGITACLLGRGQGVKEAGMDGSSMGMAYMAYSDASFGFVNIGATGMIHGSGGGAGVCDEDEDEDEALMVQSLLGPLDTLPQEVFISKQQVVKVGG